MKKLIFIFLIFISICFAEEQNSDLFKFLNSLPECEIETLEADSVFAEKYVIMFTQPLDHKNEETGSFKQRIFVSHVGTDKNTVLITEGYSAGHNYTQELAPLMNANEVRVEHRYFGKSVPDSLDWRYLNLEQTTADYHRIVTLFKEFYEKKWISTGWSKGGQTSMAYRFYYPDDVDLVVAYDAPLNFALEDERIDKFFDKVGDEKTRNKLIAFQRMVLENKKDILSRFKWYARGKKLEYSVGLEKGLEYMVLEYTFSFWQYNQLGIDDIPGENATVDEMLEHLIDIVYAGSYADQSMNSPSMYQFSTELGYYGYVQKNVKDLLSDDEYPNYAYAPQNIVLDYSPDKMRKINQWLQDKGDRMLYIYGDQDPWSAPAIELTGKADAQKVYLKDGNHYTFIKNFPEEEQKEIMKKLKKWLR